MNAIGSFGPSDLTTPLTEEEYEAWFNETDFLHEEYRQ